MATTTKKVTPKKTTTKTTKPVAKKPTTKTTAKPAVKKVVAKPTVKKTTTKTTTKKTTPKPTKTTVKKVAPKKPTVSKTTKPVAKKVTTTKTTKPVVKKPTTKPTVKKSSTENILEVRDITKNYGNLKVLKGISLDIKDGERVGIIGANGAGKSTLTEIISQIKQPTSGTVKFSFGNDKGEISKKVGIQFQESTYPMFYKTIDIIKFFIDASKSNLPKDHVKKLIKIFHLEGIENEYAQGLSGGQKQRLNILLAVIHNPQLLLLDEVSTGLDIEARTDIKEYIKNYLQNSKATLILVSHNIDELNYLVDRIIVIHDGLIYSDLSMKEIRAKHKSLDIYTEKLFTKDFKKDPETQRSANETSKKKWLSRRKK